MGCKTPQSRGKNNQIMRSLKRTKILMQICVHLPANAKQFKLFCKTYGFLHNFCIKLEKYILIMSRTKVLHSVFYIFFCVFLSNQFAFAQSTSKFKVVLDAGHGGDDPGAVRYGNKEKDIALSVVLKAGALLEKQADVEVVYTRKTDVFVGLHQRANIANKAKANLFVSVHVNSVGSPTPFGTETFVMGMSKNKSNLEVAKKENSVIFLEADYKTRYGGYDPNAPETMIGLKLSQEEHRDQSIALASKIQDGFTNGMKRYNRGVKEGPLLVLNQSYMPSVLVEIGFISNQAESKFLATEHAQNEFAKTIAQAILQYKREFYGGPEVVLQSQPTPEVKTKEETVQTTPKAQDAPSTPSATNTGVVFKVQLAASGTKMALIPANFKGLDPISAIQENNVFKYLYGNFATLDEAKAGQVEAKSKGYDQAFIVPFKDGRRVSMQEATKP